MTELVHREDTAKASYEKPIRIESLNPKRGW